MNKFPQKSIESKVREEIIKRKLVEKGDRICVALSGGPDSVTLLNVLIELKEFLGIEISACHFNHRMRGQESDQDQKFVEKLCQKNQIALEIGQAEDKNKLKSEQSAREARYVFFEKITGEKGRTDKVALAHTLNDSAETILQRLIRGTGLRGLRSIPASRDKYIRPMLSINRTEIEQYLKKNDLPYRLDSSNYDRKYFRNQIRHDLLPEIFKLNPNILRSLSDLAKQSELDYDFIEQKGQKNLKEIIISESAAEIVLDQKQWLALPPSMRSMTLRLSIARIANLDDITYAQLQEVEELIQSDIGAKYKLLPHSLRVGLSRGKIVLSYKI